MLPPVMVQALVTMAPASANQRGIADMCGSLEMKASLGPRGRLRCHDLAQFRRLARAGGAAQGLGREPEERAESCREMAVARESRVEGDGSKVEVRIEHGVQRLREP